jgi:hypothetical protein
MTVSKEDARLIADALLEGAEALDAYLDANYQIISRSEYEFLNESFKTLLRVSGFATTVAVGLAIDAMENPVTELKGVIDQVKETLIKLESVGRIIRFVAGLADLAAGIMAKDPKAIVASVANLKKEMSLGA